jgi:hypothetical protein
MRTVEPIAAGAGRDRRDISNNKARGFHDRTSVRGTSVAVRLENDHRP